MSLNCYVDTTSLIYYQRGFCTLLQFEIDGVRSRQWFLKHVRLVARCKSKLLSAPCDIFPSSAWPYNTRTKTVMIQ